MRRILLESPYASDDPAVVDGNIAYARECARDCLKRDESPLASHLVFPFILNDKIEHERALGIEAGLAWISVADAMVLYVDRGVSPGMQEAMRRAQRAGLEVVLRSIKVTEMGDGDADATGYDRSSQGA